MSHFDEDTPAHLRAAFAGDVSAVEAWLSDGGDVNQDGGWDGSLLSNAIIGSQTQMYEYLLERGARCGEADLYILVDDVLYAGRDHADVVRLLIEHGADPRSGAPGNDDTSWSVLHKLAVMMTADDYYLPENPAAEMCALLIPLFVEKGIPVDLRVTGGGGRFSVGTTPLMVAAYYSAPVVFLRELLRHGADLAATNEDGDDALLYAMMAADPEDESDSITSAADKRAILAFLLNVHEAGTYKKYVNEEAAARPPEAMRARPRDGAAPRPPRAPVPVAAPACSLGDRVGPPARSVVLEGPIFLAHVARRTLPVMCQDLS